MEAWLDTHETGELTLMDLAQLEALNGERELLGKQISDAEANLLQALKQRLID